MTKAIFRIDQTVQSIVDHAHQNRKPVLLVKDQGLYLMTRGLLVEEGETRHVVAYAQGCNPDVDDFDDWWDRCRAIAGGDDFAEELDSTMLKQKVLAGCSELHVGFTEDQMALDFVMEGKQ